MASSSSSSSSSSPAPAFSTRYSYHVFLSFRGEDTRNNFVGHLYSALEQKGIQTYKDDKTLRQGETIGPALMKGIDESQIALVVFSDNYADSSWCLDELVYIMNCKKTRGQIVMPVFYQVDPSEVRKQKRNFGEAFVKESKNETKLKSWRDALQGAGNISGFHYKDPANMDESKFIKDIVEEVSQRLHPLNSGVDANLVGVEERMEELKSKLQNGSDGVGMIGIWGVGGSGKTTLAYSVYKEVSREFDGCCFVENVREKTSKNGLAKLQDDLLCGVLNTKDVRVGGIEEGKQMIRDRLCSRKVLIVLDDVDHHDQLEALAESVDWFGNKSRVLITTRNVHLLKASGVDVHNMSLLTNDEAIKLFRKHAFKNYGPMEVFERLSKEVVSYAGGLPLALKVFGRLLCGKGMHQWKSALARLKEIPNGEVLKKLKISYDGLEPVEKQLFLDIACFFRWEDKDKAMDILDACDFHPDIGVEVLIEKALITLSEDGKFDMHDLIQEMAHYIVRGQHPKNPEKHSRIWEVGDIVNICAMDPTTELDMIEAIRYRFYFDNPLKDLPPIVANTKNLRWIDWKGDLASPLLTNFPQRTLCCLILCHSNQKQLWEGRKNLPNLKILHLLRLENLLMTPDFSGLPNLEIFKLLACANLKEVHSSLGDLKRLVTLSIEECYGIKVFPSITRLMNLKTLSFSFSPGRFELSEIQQKMGNLPHLHLDKIGGTQVKQPGEDCTCFWVLLTEILFAVKNRKEKTDVDERCIEQPCLPLNNTNNSIWLWFPHRNLTNLNLFSCDLGDEDISSSDRELPNLQELNLGGNYFLRLDFSLLRVPKLKSLDVSCCRDLVALSNLPSSIAVVQANDCPSLKTFGDTSSCKWLWKVSHKWGYRGRYKVDPFNGDRLLDSMLQGNAIEDHFISVNLEDQIPKGFVGRLFRGKTFTKRRPWWDLNTTYDSDTFTVRLPPNWYNDYCGFLIRVVTQNDMHTGVIIVIKQGADEEDSRFETWKESDEAPEPVYNDGKVKTHVGYVSFNSLRRTTLLTSSYNLISFTISDTNWTSFTAELVPRKSKDDPVQATQVAKDLSEFYTNRGFVIKQDSKSSFKISWTIYC